MPASLGLAAWGAAALACLYLALRNWRLAVSVADTARARVRSAPHGYVELYGRAEQGSAAKPVIAPLSGRHCVWWRYRVEHQRGRSWHCNSHGESEAVFLLRDETGACQVDPRGASIKPSRREIWYGSEPWPRPGTCGSLGPFGSRYRYVEETILEYDGVCALGEFAALGGMANGNRGPGSTRLLLDHRVVDRGAVGVVLGGPVGAQAMVSQGCRPVGPSMTVTASDGNLVLELAGMPAIQKLQQVMSSLSAEDQALASAGLQVGIAIDEYLEEHERGDFLVRSILGLDQARGAIAVGDVVPVGRTVRFQVRDAASADDDLRAMLVALRREYAAVEGALLFSCNGRGSNLFTSADHDVLAMRQGLSTSGVAGFFAGGEIGPVGGRNHLHGFSAAVLVFGSARVQLAEQGV